MEIAEALWEVLPVVDGGGRGTERSEADRAVQRPHHRHFLSQFLTGIWSFFRVCSLSSEFGYLSYSLPHTRLRRHSVRACGRDRFARIRRHCAVSNHSTEGLP